MKGCIMSEEKKSTVPLALIYEAIVNHPGVNTVTLARIVGIKSSAVPSRLASMQKQGLLITEDKGRFYPYE